MSESAAKSGKVAANGDNRVETADKPLSEPDVVTEADRRRLRAAEKLRENLSRRKQQVRARRAGQADETDGLPAAKMDESS